MKARLQVCVFVPMIGEPKPGTQFSPHLGDFDDIGREQRVLGDDVAFVGHVDNRPAQILVTLGDIVHRVNQADIGNR